jgi:hypothetical protein
VTKAPGTRATVEKGSDRITGRSPSPLVNYSGQLQPLVEPQPSQT